MNDKLVIAAMAALIGSVFGAGSVLFLSGKTSYDYLEVRNLTITGQAALIDPSGKEGVVIKEGSVLANNVVFGEKFIGTQYQGRVFVGNLIFTSPDDLVATPTEQWRFFTEMRSSNETGGEMIVRSSNGPNTVGQPINSGCLLRTGFGVNDQPQMFLRVNQNGRKFPVAFDLPPNTKPVPDTEAPAMATDPAAPKPQ